jgi:hypothetical protein
MRSLSKKAEAHLYRRFIPGTRTQDLIQRLPGNRPNDDLEPIKMPISPVAVECVIRAQPEKEFLRLEAVVRSDAPVSGQYSFVIAKQSSSGSTNNTQSGTFALQNEPEKVLTTLILDRSAIGHYRAELSLQSDRGRFTCTSP